MVEKAIVITILVILLMVLWWAINRLLFNEKIKELDQEIKKRSFEIASSDITWALSGKKDGKPKYTPVPRVPGPGNEYDWRKLARFMKGGENK